MSKDKSILVIDTPDSCGECPLHERDMEGVWCSQKDDTDYLKSYKKPTWCPLKPMPEMKEDKVYEPFKLYGNEETLEKYQSYIETIRNRGWNDCIYTILEGGEQWVGQ